MEKLAKTQSKRGSNAKSSSKPADAVASAAFAAEVGKLVRRARARSGMTRQQLAKQSGVSLRYIAQIESGQGNPSVLVLKAMADAIDASILDFFPAAPKRANGINTILALVSELPAANLRQVGEAIAQRLSHGGQSERSGRIALVGLRGAGKSTIGRLLAKRLGCPFIELDQCVEQAYGASLAMLIEVSGIATFRRYERTCLEEVIAKHESVVIVTAGGIVSNPETYALLLRYTHAVWIKASAAEHMARVMEQGDMRPMAKNREAMADLNAILEARRADYARAEAELDTSRQSVDQSLRKLVKIVSAFALPGRDVAGKKAARRSRPVAPEEK